MWSGHVRLILCQTRLNYYFNFIFINSQLATLPITFTSSNSWYMYIATYRDDQFIKFLLIKFYPSHAVFNLSQFSFVKDFVNSVCFHLSYGNQFLVNCKLYQQTSVSQQCIVRFLHSYNKQAICIDLCIFCFPMH